MLLSEKDKSPKYGKHDVKKTKGEYGYAELDSMRHSTKD